MGRYTQSIEINGKRYDARTGKPVEGDTPAPVKRPMSDVRPQPVSAHPVHKSAERSKTLMRHAVKRPVTKPVHRSTSAMKGTSDISRQASPIHTQSGAQIHDKNREIRAQATQRSQLVSKFSDIMSKPSGAVAGAPVVHHDTPVEKRVQPLSVQAAPAISAVPASPSHQRTESILAKGLQAAQSHNEPMAHVGKSHTKRAKRARFASVAAGSLAVLLLGTFFAYQNAPNLSMRYAATRAGINASLPGYRPSGFALDRSIKYTPGNITVTFASNTDDRSFSITQKRSSWDSDTLMSNYVASTSEQVQTYEDKGRTIYLYGDSNATWVNGGIWYDINGNSQLTSDQLIRIATSI